MSRKILLSGPVIFVVMVLILEHITPGYDWTKNYISELSLGKYGVGQQINFIVSGMLIAGLGVNLAMNGQSFWIRTGWMFGALSGVAMIVAGLWNTDVADVVRSQGGLIHEAGYWVGIVGSILALLLVGLGNRKKKTIFIYSIVEVVFVIVMVLWGGYWIKSGIYQRLLLYSILIWTEVVAVMSLKVIGPVGQSELANRK